MYSGLTIFSKHSGILLGAHQKIDRVARKQLQRIIGDTHDFPTIKNILHFEGVNGPDGIKRKSPSHDEPWHFFNPFDDNDTQLKALIADHYDKLVQELKAGNQERSAFEAAWLAHAIVDGLTPAHHYPYEEELIQLRGGEGLETRTNYRKKLIMPGKTRRAKVRNNWKMWGGGGLYTTHASFEMGVAMLIAPLTFKESQPTAMELKRAKELGAVELFNRAAREIAVLDMYHNYRKKGWTPKLAWQVRHRLGPIIVQTLTTVWYLAVQDANTNKPS